MKKTTRSNSKASPSAYALVCCLAVSTCNAFQASHFSTALGTFSSSSTATTTPLHVSSRRQAAPAERKAKSKKGSQMWRGAKRNGPAAASTMQTRRMNKKSHPNDYLMMKDALRHDLLTKEEEKELGLKIQQASRLKAKVAKFVEHMQLGLQELNMKEEEAYMNEFTSDMLVDRYPSLGIDEEDIDGLSIFGLTNDRLEEMETRSLSGMVDDIEDWNFERLKETDYDILGTDQTSSLQTNSNPLSIDNILTEEDVVSELNIAGGRDELARIILDGALAKEKLISSNIRLVLSIAKTWCQRSTAVSTTAQYAGGWDRPSLEEAIQEGILGLSVAAERFEPERNLRFATYATWWVTNSVRSCFNTAKEVGLRVPVYYHAYRQKYQAFVMKQYELTGNGVTLEDAAKELNLTPKRLAFILQSTTAPISINAPLNQFQKVSMPGKAGTDDPSNDLSGMAGNLKSTEPSLEDQIEISLLRQCLENAMATELSPHERDILRLRHGLDDGVSRTAREVAEICGGSVSLSDVRNVEMRACRKLRSPYSVHTARLQDFLDFVGADIRSAKL